MIQSSVVLTGHEISGDALTLPLQVSKAFLPLQGMTLIPHVNSRAPFDFAKINALPQDITNDIVCDTLQSFPICSIRRFLVHCTPVRVDKCEVSIPQHTAS